MLHKMHMHSTPVKGDTFQLSQDAERKAEKVRLLKRLAELYPGAQEVRALAIGVDQTTLSRWESAIEKGGDPKIGPSNMARLRWAVAVGEGKRPDYVRGRDQKKPRNGRTERAPFVSRYRPGRHERPGREALTRPLLTPDGRRWSALA